jgi:hypothetical protein
MGLFLLDGGVAILAYHSVALHGTYWAASFRTGYVSVSTERIDTWFWVSNETVVTAF